VPGVRHALWVLTRPAALFSRVEDTGAYGWTLATLLCLVMLVGYAQVQTGLIDRVVDRQTEAKLAELEKTQLEAMGRLALRDRMEALRKEGEFNKLLTRLGVVAFSPIYTLACFLAISSVLYAVVALSGSKPQYHTLMAICVYSGVVVLVSQMLRLGMMVFYHTNEVDTSLGMLTPPGRPSVLAAVDPFRIWFWLLVAVGLTVTQQLSRRSALVTCAVLCLLAMGARVALQYAPWGVKLS